MFLSQIIFQLAGYKAPEYPFPLAGEEFQRSCVMNMETAQIAAQV